jgi:hypothetical protein
MQTDGLKLHAAFRRLVLEAPRRTSGYPLYGLSAKAARNTLITHLQYYQRDLYGWFQGPPTTADVAA